MDRTSVKIVVAGGFGTGKTTLVGVGQRDPAAGHRGGPDPGQRRRGRHHRRGGQDAHHGRAGLRPHHDQPRRGALPVRHPGPGPVLVHLGRAGAGRGGRDRAGRHPAAGAPASPPSTTSSGGASRSSPRSTASTASAPYTEDEIRAALELDPTRAAAVVRRAGPGVQQAGADRAGRTRWPGTAPPPAMRPVDRLAWSTPGRAGTPASTARASAVPVSEPAASRTLKWRSSGGAETIR